MSAPRLYRTAGLIDLATRNDGTGRTICGTAVPIGVEAEVSDGYGTYTERFAPGSFRRTLAERGPGKVKAYANHGRSRLPIGKATVLREEPGRLYCELALSRTAEADEVLELVRDGVADSLSIGFRSIAHRNVGHVLERTEVALDEVSIVAHPAYQGATIAAVRQELPPLSADLARRQLDELKLKVRSL